MKQISADETIHSANATDANVIETNNPGDEPKHSQTRTNFEQLSEFWNNSIRRNSADLPFIDGFGIRNKSIETTEEVASPKKFIPARNLLDQPKHLDVSDDGAEADGDDESDNEIENKPRNEFLDDEAEEASYDEGDSMDEEERQYIQQNEIVEVGIHLGTEDTDEEENDDEECEKDSFIATDDDVHDAVSDADTDEDDFDRMAKKKPETKTAATPKYRRLVVASDSDSDEADLNEKNKSQVDIILNGRKPTAPTTEEDIVVADGNALNATSKSDAGKGVPIKTNADLIIETTKTAQSSVESGAISTLGESNEPTGQSVVYENNNKSLIQTGFEETNRMPPDGAPSTSLPLSRNRNVSISFVEEDFIADMNETVNKTSGKVAAEFDETENTSAPIDSELDAATENEDEDDVTDNEIRFSLNKSDPKTARILASALARVASCSNSMFTDIEEAVARTDEIAAAIIATDKRVEKAKGLEKQPSSDLDGDVEVFYSFNEAQPAARESPLNVPATKSHSHSEEQIVPTAVLSMSSKRQQTPKQDKENVSENPLSVVDKMKANRSLQGNQHVPLKPFWKKSENQSVGDIDTDQSLQINPLSTHFDINASNLGRSSTPNPKALLKSKAPTTKVETNPNEMQCSSVQINCLKSSQTSPPETNNNVKMALGSPTGNCAARNVCRNSPIFIYFVKFSGSAARPGGNLTEILNRCDTELVDVEQKKKRKRAEAQLDDVSIQSL